MINPPPPPKPPTPHKEMLVTNFFSPSQEMDAKLLASKIQDDDLQDDKDIDAKT